LVSQTVGDACPYKQYIPFIKVLLVLFFQDKNRKSHPLTISHALCDGYHNLPVEMGGKIVYNKGSSRKGGKMKKQLKGEKNDGKKKKK
jgi:hypothetical protein